MISSQNGSIFLAVASNSNIIRTQVSGMEHVFVTNKYIPCIFKPADQKGLNIAKRAWTRQLTRLLSNGKNVYININNYFSNRPNLTSRAWLQIIQGHSPDASIVLTVLMRLLCIIMSWWEHPFIITVWSNLYKVDFLKLGYLKIFHTASNKTNTSLQLQYMISQ